ncbi:MAG: PEP-CTERM sorting domain-containing protein [Planctomycetota bacterium]
MLARLESSGNQDQNVWSSQIFDITLTSAPIPEPGSLALVGMGGLALVARRRRS